MRTYLLAVLVVLAGLVWLDVDRDSSPAIAGRVPTATASPTPPAPTATATATRPLPVVSPTATATRKPEPTATSTATAPAPAPTATAALPTPTLTASAPAVPAGPGWLTEAEVRALAAPYPWPVELAVAHARCETGGTFNPRAVNHADPEGSWGIWQINYYWNKDRIGYAPPEVLWDPELNARIAYEIWRDSGGSFHLWHCL